MKVTPVTTFSFLLSVVKSWLTFISEGPSAFTMTFKSVNIIFFKIVVYFGSFHFSVYLSSVSLYVLAFTPLNCNLRLKDV